MAKKTNEQYLLDLRKVTTSIVPIEDYIGTNKHSLHKCLVCLHEWSPTPNRLLSGTKCPECSRKSRFLTQETAFAKVSEMGFELLSQFSGTLASVTVKGACGHVWTTKYANIHEGSGCPTCNKGFGYLHKTNLPLRAQLYVLAIQFSEHKFLKIGITSQTLASRVREIRSRIYKATNTLPEIVPIYTVESSGGSILDLEARLAGYLVQHRAESPVRFDGYTELYNRNSLNLIEDVFMGLDNNYNVEII